MAFNVTQAFEQFCKNLRFSEDSIEKISTRYHAITKRINIDFRGNYSDTSYSLYVGSYGRDTEIHTSDIDMLVQLPYETYKKYDSYSGNGQSALLQEVKKSIQKTYSSTNLKADGQIVSVTFTDGINFEVLPAFLNTDKSYTFPNSNYGGAWKITDPKSEINAIKEMNDECNSNLKRLCRMTRAWKEENNVDISGLLIDVLCYNFISSYSYRDKSYLYYDYMTRDFLKYLSEVPRTQTQWKVMGSSRFISWTGVFQNKAASFHEKAVTAISYEKNYPTSANSIWREIYGTKFPLM